MDNKNWCLYFHLTRRKHSSGYLIIEVGYTDGEHYLPVGQCSDAINLWSTRRGLSEVSNYDFSIDTDKYGYFRIWTYSCPVRWVRPTLSSALIEEGEPPMELINKLLKKEQENAKNQ